MHRTQIYFEEEVFEEIKKTARTMNVSVSSFIRTTLAKEIEAKKKAKKPLDFSEFAGLWADSDIDQKSLRKKAWK